MKIIIEHLGFTVNVKDLKKKAPCKNAIAWIEYDTNHECTVYIKQPIKPYQVPTLAHELVHVLQYVAEMRNISFIEEREHFAYLMQWLLNQVLGYSYFDKNK